MPPFSICIFGLSSAGKTTIAKLLVKKLRHEGDHCAFIDGGEIREFFDK